MDNNACLYPNEGFENISPLTAKNPENETCQDQNGAYCQFKPPENIPNNPNDLPYDPLIVKDNKIDYESFRINSQMNKYHISQPNPYTFHISTGEKWSPLIKFAIAIILIIFSISVISGALQTDENGIIIIIFTPCMVVYLICTCLRKCCKNYNADIIMMDNSLIIKSRSCVCRRTKTYRPGQIKGISIYSKNNINEYDKKKYKVEILLTNKDPYTLMVLPGSLGDEEIDYFLKVVNDYIKNKMKI